MQNSLTVLTTIKAPIEQIWDAWNNPDHITKWSFASDDWECIHATNDLKVGGRASISMAAKDKSFTFDLTYEYTEVIKHQKIAYQMEDGRKVEILFKKIDDTLYTLVEEFQMERENTPEIQREGWQAILHNFKRYVETL